MGASVYACSATDSLPSTVEADAAASSDATSAADQSNVTSDAGFDGAVTDGGLGADAAADAGFTPATLGGKLVLWLEADPAKTLLDAGLVTTWTDQSGQSNHAQQGVPAHQPALTLDSGLSGKPALHFGGAQTLIIQDSVSLQWGASDFAFYAVMRYVNTAANYAIAYGKFSSTVSSPGFFLWAAYPTTDSYVTRMDSITPLTADGGPYNDNVMRIVGARKVGNALELRVNGVVTASNPDVSGYDVTAANAVGIPSFIGGRDSVNFQNLDGDVAEMVGLKGTISDAEQTKIEAYLKAKYGL